MYSYEVRTYVRRILRKIHVCTLIVPNHTNTLCHRLTFFQSSNSTQGEKWPLVHLYHRLLSCHTPPIRNQPSPYPILPYTLHYSVNIQLTSPHPHIPTILTYHFAPLPSLQQIEISIPRPLLHLLHLPLIPLPYPPPPPPPPSSPPPPPPLEIVVITTTYIHRTNSLNRNLAIPFHLRVCACMCVCEAAFR